VSTGDIVALSIAVLLGVYLVYVLVNPGRL